MKPRNDEAALAKRAGDCAALIRSDAGVREIWCEIAGRCEFTPNAAHAFDVLAGTVAGLHFALPKKAASERLERRRKLERAINKFRSEIETYERQSGDGLPSPSDVIYRADVEATTDAFLRQLPSLDVATYLDALAEHLHSSEGGTWIHPMLSTPSGRWPSTPNSSAVIWIIRAQDMVGVPRVSDRDRGAFLCLAVRMAELIQASAPGCDITPSRKDFENHPEFTGNGSEQWR